GGVILVLVVVRQKVFKMTEEDWNTYFNTLEKGKLLLSGFILYIISLMIVSWMGYYIFKAFAFENILFLSIITFILGMAKILFEYKKRGPELLNKLKHLGTK
ncbi:MAG: hypothetical protein RSC14_05025, partial [Niameybacter sp.]